MELHKMQVEYYHKGGFMPTTFNNICHVKALPFLSVAQAIEGNYDIQLGDRPMQNTGKAGFFIAPADIKQTIVHHDDPDKKRMVCRWIFIKLRINDHYQLDRLYDFPTILPEPQKTAMNALFDRLFNTTDLCEEYSCYYGIVGLLLQVAQEKKHTIPQNLGKAVAYIKTHYQEKITVEMMAKEANMSISYFFAAFKKETGVSPIAFLNNYRLSAAVDLLVNSRKNLTEIANCIGIHDPIYFNKLFRKAYQLPPSRYREVYAPK